MVWNQKPRCSPSLRPGLEFHNRTGAFAKVPAQEVVVVYFSEEAYSLAVASAGVGQCRFVGDAAHFGLGQPAERKFQRRQLAAGDPCKEVGLVLYRVCCRGQPFAPLLIDGGGCVVAGYRGCEVLAPPFLEVAELDNGIAHYVGIGRKSLADGSQGVVHHIIPVLLVQRHHIERQAVAPGDECAYLYVLVG